MQDIDKKDFKVLLPNCKTVLDIGSFNGKDAHELSYVLDCDVHCFEPDKDNFEKIKGLQNDRMILWPYAIGAWHGKAPFVKSKNHPASHSMRAPLKHKDVWPGIKFSRTSHMVNFAKYLYKVWASSTTFFVIIGNFGSLIIASI